MVQRQPSLPDLWLISDARNDAALERALEKLPRGSGFIYRHYHLPEAERQARFAYLKRIARQRGHVVVLSGDPRLARRWSADGAYGSPQLLARGPATLRLATAHSLRELGEARRARADAVLLSPVFATRSHPGVRTLGPARFRLLAARAGCPAIALGGMTARRTRRLRQRKWAAIDAFCGKANRGNPLDS